MKTLALVTSVYDLVKRGSPDHRTVDWVFTNADFVLGLDRELVIFTDPELETELRKRRGGRPTKIVPVPFEILLGPKRCAAAEQGSLQSNARRSKVTSTYVQLMWAKYAMLHTALEITNSSHLGWIDLGITHVAERPPEGVDVFADPPDLPRVHVLRCFSKRDVDSPDYWRSVQGHLAGGLVVGSRGKMKTLVDDFWRALDRAAEMKLAPLDEGLLSYVVGQRPHDFSYSYGDYADIVRNHDQPRGGEAHCKWITEDAIARGLPTTMGATSPGKPLLGLVMIVRNEAKRIERVLASYRDHIDAFTILDTGSTDGTQDLIRASLAGLPGTIHEEPFVDFATSRNRALALHGEATTFTIMPNGDVLEGGSVLRSFLSANRTDRAGAYRVRISPGHYYHPLVMRAGAGWHYRWRTHECAIGPNIGPMIDGVVVHRDRGERSTAEWHVRWQRDLELLNRDRMDDPSDPRPYFYLGQTHECLGQFAQALAFFERRTELGGYFDEVYEAKYRVAKMMSVLDRPWAEVQQKFLEAYQHDPRRAEPLYAIADYWYSKDVHAVARVFATAAADLPKPPTDLFLDEEVYTWKAADMASISSFYAGHKEAGRKYADKAVLASPHDERLRANRSFYAQDARQMFGAVCRGIDFTPEPGWNASNPSIYGGRNGLRCIVRTVNYRIVDGRYVTPDNDGVIRTRNYLLDLNDRLETTRKVELVDRVTIPRTNFPIHGFEDARLFEWKDKWWATATICDFTEDGRREIALLELDPEGGAVTAAHPLRGPWSNRAQKNWMPAVVGDTVGLIYAANPTTIFEVAGGPDGHALACRADASFDHGRLRGGSQAVRVEGGWLCVVHDVTFPGGGRAYLHRFVLLDLLLQHVVSMSDLFYFEHLGIEFCAGLARVGEKLVASYAVNDGSARLATFDVDAVMRALRTDFVI